MKKFIILFSILIGNHTIFAQSETLYLMIDKPFFMQIDGGGIETGFIIKSTDKRFICDYYKFQIFNSYFSQELNDIAYYALKDLRKEININSIKYQTSEDFTKNKEFWEVHNELSLKKNIYLLERKTIKNYSNDNGDSYRYFMLPMIYEGTRKNIIPTDLSKSNN